MKILIDIGHPAHVHFYAEPIRIWREQGCQVVVTSRDKEMAVPLLDAMGVRHTVLSRRNAGSLGGMLAEFLQRDLGLYRVVRRERPDILTGIGGIFAAHAGFCTRTPSVVFYDTENAILSNAITYPFASLVAVPGCYSAWLPPWHLRYPGYHELSYLHPSRFKPCLEKAVACGLEPGRRNFLLRTVSWAASHDLREEGWTLDLLRRLTAWLAERGKVHLSTEGALPPDLLPFRYQGRPLDIHHLMAHLDLFVGESATMASECAVLGVPAIYAARTGRGYTDEQESRYGLVRNLRSFGFDALCRTVDGMLAEPAESWKRKQELLLAKTIDVAAFVADLVRGFPDSNRRYRSQFRKERG